ncbi:hypothetical protein BSL78_22859 [Apostichopus japonicus]|uniref:Uncharacterized protein n=1 Tax=Stichopus japonicus TaxID=307972 RepID=A0A2G8JX33_STIJA|nr:hypothetical protein BSL78_22859 [Apostichopus japonicus]
MDFQRIAVYLTLVYCFFVVLPSINGDCADRACFPPSPDLTGPQDMVAIADRGRKCHIVPFSRDTFLFQATQLVFQSLRPNSLVIEKSEDHGQTWAPLRYYARSCAVSFPDVAFLAQDAFEENHNVVSGCMQRYYYGDAASFDSSNELQQVIYNPVSELGARFYQQDVLEFFRFTDIRINLVKPGSSDAGRDYFAVADWSVTGHCLCYGHAEKCIGQNEASCVCEHNTMGQHCDQCKPLYNNKPWAAAFMGHPNECEDCGCSGRTTSCTYDEDKGYGVCDNCTENSTGEKCDHCIEDFFINPGTGEADPFCIPCNCTAIGIVPGSVCNETQGQCVCKENVQGRQCQECKDSYYQLDRRNAQGCQMCDCDTRGTDGAPNFCDKLNGQCICKTNVEGIRCDLCKPGFFNLSLADPDGCTPCDCNGGGALSNTCNNLTGLCDCKMNIGGRSCDVVDSGFYVPLLDGIKIEAELLDTLQMASLVERPETAMPRSSGRGLLLVPAATSLTYPSMTVPRTQRYDIVVRYSTPSISSNNRLSLSAPGNTISYSCAGSGSILEPPQLTFDLSETTNLSAVSIGQACLAAGIVYEPNFTAGASLGSGLAIDTFVFLPVLADLSVYTESGNESLFIESCWEDAKVSDGVLRSEGNCSKVEFVVMAELYNGAIGCTCNVSGSSNSASCDPRRSCDCLPGVSGRECDYCSAYHYDFMPGVGCQACNCDPFGSQEQSCYLSGGVCDCKANVTGDRCDQCLPEHYGLTSGTGCAPCLCEPLYSLHNQCNQTGQCDCKPGVSGLTCSTCLTGFFNLTSEGCQECLCNPLGSRDGICRSDGQCDCLEAAVGLKCDTCPETSEEDPARIESSGQLTFTHILTLNRFVLELEGRDAEEDLFFVSPDVYRGDLRTAYGQVLHFVLSQTTVENQSRFLDGDVFLYGLYSEEPLVTGLPSNPSLEETPYSFKLHERYWRIGNMSGKQPDMVDMVRILSALDQIKIRGKYTQLVDNSVFLHEVRVTLASDDNALSSNPPAEFVEQCQCPDQYNGQFCESCMLGYRWQDPSMGPFSDCVLCDCNSHSLLPCDIMSGRCSNCTHNTAGDFCEICADGFYGNATIGSSGRLDIFKDLPFFLQLIALLDIKCIILILLFSIQTCWIGCP